jgi:hypothetical protein
MGHPQIDNKTPFVFETLFLVDEAFRPLVVPVVKATWTLAADGHSGRLLLAEQQLPLNLGGELWGEPETSSYKYEPEVAFSKPATDVVMIGHAYAPRADTKEMIVGLRVGALSKEIVASGDRIWFKTLGSIAMSGAVHFEKIPLVYERAFGGWDRDNPDPRKHSVEARNPVGQGYRSAGGFVDGLHLPNLEDPRARIKGLGDRPAPAGFGFVSPHWQPRAALAGTYDEAWKKERAPLLPKNFDRKHLNAASPGLVAAGYLQGNEQVAIAGATPEGRLSFALPGLAPPAVEVRLTDGPPQAVAMALDTVIIEPDPDARRVTMLWRGNLPLRTGPHDVRGVVASA